MNLPQDRYEIIIVGAGHAGCEAALVAAKMGAKTLLITMNISTIAQMSCNPAIGGLAKGHLVREIDALGGQMGLIADETGIQFRMLNKSKGPAVWSPRSQNDRVQYSLCMRRILENQSGLQIRQDSVNGLIVKNGKVVGVETLIGTKITCNAVILCAGTFLNGLIHVGLKSYSAGRAGEFAAFGTSDQLRELGFEVGRLKTGTPPRVDGKSINFENTEIQYGDENPKPYSFRNKEILVDQIPCYLTKTTEKTHKILANGLDRSPLYTGKIVGTGPRYCPSIEDKIVRFADKPNHQIFLEPEGRNTNEYYVNGFATSLPEDVQVKALRTIQGLENANPTRLGYAIEYDYFQPTQLWHTLETKQIENLFFAGQINGTSGYEEAAAQGLMAGINAVLKIRGEEPFILNRSDAYIGVLIDDLVTKGTNEPYRMFTSLAEYRLLLRQDNADLRLMDFGYEFGLIPPKMHESLVQKKENIKSAIDHLNSLKPPVDKINSIFEKIGSSKINTRESLAKLLKRPEVRLEHFGGLDNSELLAPKHDSFWGGVREQVEIEIKYQGFFKRQQEDVKRLLKMETTSIPEDFCYDDVNSLSTEGREKLERITPRTLAQASRISGVSASDISILMIYLAQQAKKR